MDKLGDISATKDVDLDLLRMLLRLLVMRATALGLRPMDSNGVRTGGTEQQDCEDEATVTEKVRGERDSPRNQIHFFSDIENCNR